MPFGQVHDMYVVSDACAVWRGIVIAKDIQCLALTRSHLGDVGHQIVRHAVWVLADQPTFVGAHRVEIAQAGNPPRSVRCRHVAQHFFNVQFASAIGVDGMGRVIFINWQILWLPIDSGTAAEHEFLHLL